MLGGNSREPIFQFGNSRLAIHFWHCLGVNSPRVAAERLWHSHIYSRLNPVDINIALYYHRHHQPAAKPQGKVLSGVC